MPQIPPKLLLMLASTTSIGLGALQVLALNNPAGIGYALWIALGGSAAALAVQDYQENGLRNVGVGFVLLAFVGISLWLPTSGRIERETNHDPQPIPEKVHPAPHRQII